ncbi:MAG: IS256 family transposase [Bacteroidota bacterium]|nr:IS256 family transposase [Bacteroidota bacterium]
MAKYNKRKSETTLKTQRGTSIPEVRHTLDEHIRKAIQEKLPELLDEELQEYLGRQWYEHHSDDTPKQYRNGYGKQRNISSGCGTISVQVPRLREPYESKIVGRYQRMTDGIRATLPDLYLHGLATGDFGQCLHQLLGEEASLSDSTIVRLKEKWKTEYNEWKRRKLHREYLYLWIDGIYPKAGPKDDKMALLVAVGLNQRGEKELLAIEEGYRESSESWRDLLRDLKKRGVRWIGLTVADGIAGVWKALRDVFPHARQQRCWIHKMRNIIDKVPTHAEDEIREELRAMYHARSRKDALRLKTEFIQKYRSVYPKAVDSLEEAGDRLFTYFDFPRCHWPSIKSTNVIESIFSSVKLRTDAARRIRRRDSATYLVFKLLMVAEHNLNRIRGYRFVAQTIDNFNKQRPLSKVRYAA